MARIATLADKEAIEAEMPWQRRWTARTLHAQLVETAGRVPGRKAVTFQLKSGPRDKALTLTWAELLAEVTRAANLFRRLGIGPGDTVGPGEHLDERRRCGVQRRPRAWRASRTPSQPVAAGDGSRGLRRAHHAPEYRRATRARRRQARTSWRMKAT